MENGTETEKRTYGWYARHYINHLTGVPEVRDVDRESCNAPTPRTNLENLTTLGLVDQVPDVENVTRVLEGLKVGDPGPRDWTARPIGKGRPWETMHWIISDVFKDPTLDPALLLLVLEKDPERFVIPVVSHPRCPDEVVLRCLKSDPGVDHTRQTKGGEIACFVLHNRDLSGHLVDACARAARKATVQKDIIVHKNVTRETLVFLVNHGKTDPVKREALLALHQKGWLNLQ